MRFSKLVKSIDYATYPSLQELHKISQKLRDSVSMLTDILLSSIIAITLNKATLIQLTVLKINTNSNYAFLQSIISSNSPISLEQLSTIIAIFLGFVLYCLILVVKWFCVRRRYNDKRKVSQRKRIFYDFNKIAIPQLVLIKSLLEQHDTTCETDTNKRFLLLLQVKFEICELILILDRLNVLEVRKDGTLLNNSKDVLDLIGRQAYYTVLEDVICCISKTTDNFHAFEDRANDLIKSINALVLSSNAIQTARKLNSEFEKKYEKAMRQKVP